MVSDLVADNDSEVGIKVGCWGVVAALWVPGSLGDICARLSLVIRTSTSGGREMVAGRSDMPKARQDVGSAASRGTW